MANLRSGPATPARNILGNNGLMTCQISRALSLAVAILFAGLSSTSIASAQDVMQLDLMFKDSLLRRPSSEGAVQVGPGQGDQGRGQGVGASKPAVKAVRRRPRRHRKT